MAGQYIILKRGPKESIFSMTEKSDGTKMGSFKSIEDIGDSNLTEFSPVKANELVKILQRQWPHVKFETRPADEIVNEMSGTGTGGTFKPGQGEQTAIPAAFVRKDINEGYNQFKKQVTTKTPQSSSNAAVRTIRRKLKEINKIMDYSHKLKEEVGGNNKAKTEMVNELHSYLREISKKLKKL